RLSAAGATIRLGDSATLLRLDAHRVTGAALSSGEQLSADFYVAAMPHHTLGAMLPERAVTRFSYFQQIGGLQDVPAVAVTLHLDSTAPPPRLLLHQPAPDNPFQWSIVAPQTDGRATLTCVAAGAGAPLGDPDDVLIDRAARLARLIGAPIQDAKIVATQVARIDRAYLALPPGSAALRPIQSSPFTNLFVAGDWTDTALPATLESAVLSGERCAHAILEKR